MDEVLTLLSKQRDVMYLTWSIVQDHKTGLYTVHLTTIDSSAKFVGEQESLLPKVIDALLKLKGKESWSLKKARDKWKRK